MSKSLSGSSNVDLIVNTLSFQDITGTNLTATSKMTAGEGEITGNLILGSLTNVESSITTNTTNITNLQNNKQDAITAGDGLSFSTNTLNALTGNGIQISNDEITFNGSLNAGTNISTTGIIEAGTLKYIDTNSVSQSVETQIDSKQDTITAGAGLRFATATGDGNTLNVLAEEGVAITAGGSLKFDGEDLALGQIIETTGKIQGGTLKYVDTNSQVQDVETKINTLTTELGNKQGTLTAGTNITITADSPNAGDTTISASGSGITAGVGLTSTPTALGDELSFTGGDLGSAVIRTGGDITLDSTNTLTVGSSATLDCNGNCDVAGDFTLNGDNVISVSTLTGKSITTIGGNTRDYRTALQMGFTQKQYGIGIIDDTNDKLAIVVNPQVATPNVLMEMDLNGNMKILGTFHIGAVNIGNTISSNTTNITTNATNISTNTTNISTNTTNITTNATNITTINNTLSGYTYTSGTDTTRINNNFEIGSSTTSKTVSINGELIGDIINGLIPTIPTYSALNNGGLAINASNEFSLDFTNLNAGISIPQDITLTSDADILINDGKTTLRDGGRQLLIVDFDKNKASTGTWGSNSYFNTTQKQLRIGNAFYYSNNPGNGQFKMIGSGTYRISVKCSAENVSFGDRVCVGLYVSINGDTGAGKWRTETESGKFGMMYLRFDNYGFAGNMFFEDYYELNANDYVSIKTKLGEGSDNRSWNDTHDDSSINLYTHMEIEKISSSQTILVSGSN